MFNKRTHQFSLFNNLNYIWAEGRAHCTQNCSHCFGPPSISFQNARNRSDLLKKITSIHNYWLIIVFQKEKFSCACWITIPSYWYTWKTLSLEFALPPLCQLLTKLLEQVINKSTCTKHCMPFPSFNLTSHSHSVSIFQTGSGSRGTLGFDVTLQGCRGRGSQVLSLLPDPSLPTPAWIPTNLQVLFNWGSCTSTKVFSPLLKFWCLLLPTFSCHGFCRWSYRAIYMILHYENLLPEARDPFPVLFPWLHFSRSFAQRSLHFGTNLIPSMFP